MTSEPFASHGKSAAVADSPRRGLKGRLERALERMVRSFLMLWVLAAVLVFVSFVKPPRDYLRAADWQLDGGPVESYEIGVPRMIEGGPEPVWIVRLDERAFAALAAVCQYQHCVLRWSPSLGSFSCPCHHGTYDFEGRVTSGPSREPLRRFFINVKAERLRVHLRRTIPRVEE